MLRTLFIAAGFLCIPFVANAQQWAPVGARWYYSVSSGSPAQYVYIVSEKDTIVDNHQCSKLVSYTVMATQSGPGAPFTYVHRKGETHYMYSNLQAVYDYDPYLRYFYMLYDFTVQAGRVVVVRDTIPFHCQSRYTDMYCSNFIYRVKSRTNVFVSNTNLIQLEPEVYQPYTWSFANALASNLPIIERIGSTYYLFGQSKNIVMEGAITNLRCYQEPSGFIYRDPNWKLPCDYISNISGLTLTEKTTLSVYPNPCKNYVQLNNTLEETVFVEISDVTGTVLLRDYFRGSLSLDVTHLKNGLYLLKSTSTKGVQTFKLSKESH